MTALARVSTADAESLAALHRTAIDPPWDAGAFRALLAGPGVFGFAAPNEPPVHAFILARAAGGEAEILTLVTAAAARRTGLARALVRAAAAEAAGCGASAVFLEVAADNEAAIALYAELGFAEAGRRAGYYVRKNSAIDAILMRAALPLR